jgi:2-oxoglutarate ferredoxin oxidoreductase subunit delta
MRKETCHIFIMGGAAFEAPDFLDWGAEFSLKGRIIINRDLCKECHLCIYACKKGHISPTKDYNSKGYRPVSFSEDGGCTGCALCAIICPEIAIEVYRD